MGVLLAKPRTEKKVEDGESDLAHYGVASMQGWRRRMEDAHLAVHAADKELCLYGVFDGHGGPSVATWVAHHFDEVFRECQDRLTGYLANENSQALENHSTSSDEKEESVALCNAAICDGCGDEVKLSSHVQSTLLRRLNVTPPYKQQWEWRLSTVYDLPCAERRCPSSLPLDVIVLCESLQRSFLAIDEKLRLQPIRSELEKIYHESEKKEKEEEEKARSTPNSQQKNDSSELDAGYTLRPLNIVEKYLSQFRMKPTPVVSILQDGENSSFSVSSSTSAPPFSGEDCSGVSTEDYPLMEEKNNETLPLALPVQNTPSTKSPLNLQPCLTPPYHPEACGATAVVALLYRTSAGKPLLIVANAGDSRAVLSRDGLAIPLSRDHKPEMADENRRICAAGGKVIAGRVDGNLNLSRTVGDLLYKSNPKLPAENQKISALPDIRIVEIGPADEFAIIACDGIWDCIGNQPLVDFVRGRIAEFKENDGEKSRLSAICEEICDKCIARHPGESKNGIGCDNMTVMIVELQPMFTKGEEGQGSGPPALYVGGLYRWFNSYSERSLPSIDLKMN